MRPTSKRRGPSPARLASSLVLVVAALGATAGAARAESHPLETEAPPIGPWKVLLGATAGFADYPSSGIGAENLWSGGAYLGGTYRVGTATDLGLELDARVISMDAVRALPYLGEVVTNGGSYAFTPAARVSELVPLGRGAVALALVGRLGATVERYVQSWIRTYDSSGFPILTPVDGPRRRAGLALGLSAGLEFALGARGHARAEAGWTMAYFPPDEQTSTLRTSSGARHEATLRFSFVYDVPRRAD